MAQRTRPATCVCAYRWYGNTTHSHAATTAGPATRYPKRAPAMAHVLEKVRVTTNPRYVSPRSVNTTTKNYP